MGKIENGERHLDGENANERVKRDNITDWGLDCFQTHYGDKGINKEEIFLLYLCSISSSRIFRKV